MRGDNDMLTAFSDIEAAKCWFQDAQFGMFIHWGLYAIPAGVWWGQPVPWLGEWIMHTAKIPVREYEQLANNFNPVRFDARQWVRLAEDAGMRYVVFTAKHHEGFAMFRSKADRFNIVDATPFGRDPVEELADACSRTSVRLALYYSQAQDWHEPHAGTGEFDEGYGNRWDFPEGTPEGFQAYMERKALPQIKELLTQYGPVAMMWFDNTIASFNRQHAQTVKQLVRSLQPQCLISARIGHGIGDIRGFGDNQLPADMLACPAEACVTMNETWGYKRDGGRWKSVQELQQIREQAASRNCNLLLNVGPMADGRFPPEAVERLEAFARRHD